MKEQGTRGGISFFEKYLTIFVVLCTIAGIVLGKFAPMVAQTLDGIAIYVGNAPAISIPIAICLFFMMYPIMVKIDFGEVIRAGKRAKPVGLTLFVNWAVKPFTMYGIAMFFLGTAFYTFIGPDATDLVKMPFGLDLTVGTEHGAGVIVLVDGVKMMQIPLWRSYLAGAILLGIAPCTAMAGVSAVDTDLRRLAPGSGLPLAPVDHPSQGRAMVHAEISPRAYAGDDNRAIDHADPPVLVQRRSHPP